MRELKQKILDASVRMIEKEGVRSLSFREIARRAKVSHQAPYHYFSDHHEILKEIARQGFVQLGEDLQKAADKASGDVLEALCASGEAYIQFAREHSGHFRVMFQKSLMATAGKSSTVPEGEASYGVLLGLTKNVHDAGYAKGLPYEQLAMMCWSLVHGMASLLSDGGVDHCSPQEAQALVIGGMRQLIGASRSQKKGDVQLL